MTEQSISTHVASHPRMAGVLFLLVLLLTQVGTVAAGGAGAYFGP